MAAPDWVTLTEGEEIVWSGRPSTVRVLEELVGEFLLIAAGVALVLPPVQQLFPAQIPDVGYYPLAISAVGFLLAAATWIRFKNVAYVVTTKEIYKKEGLVGRTVQTMRLDRVQDHGYQQSATQRLAGYGDMFVRTAGSDDTDLTLDDVPNPDQVSAHVSEQLEAQRVRRAQPAR